MNSNSNYLRYAVSENPDLSSQLSWSRHRIDLFRTKRNKHGLSFFSIRKCDSKNGDNSNYLTIYLLYQMWLLTVQVLLLALKNVARTRQTPHTQKGMP
jgi:hypothetical protein